MIALQSIAIVWLGGGSIAMLIACIITSKWFRRLRSRINADEDGNDHHTGMV